MAKCATCVFHEKDKRMENAWFFANYNEEKTMRFPCVYPNAWETHVAQLAMYEREFLTKLAHFVAFCSDVISKRAE